MLNPLLVMISEAFKNEILKILSLLNTEQRKEALTYLKSFLKRTKNSNQQLLQFAGVFDSKDIQEISAVIDADCENIDKNEW